MHARTDTCGAAFPVRRWQADPHRSSSAPLPALRQISARSSAPIHFFYPSLSPLPKSILPKYLNRIGQIATQAARSATPWRPPPLGEKILFAQCHPWTLGACCLLVGPGALCVCWVQPWFVAFGVLFRFDFWIFCHFIIPFSLAGVTIILCRPCRFRPCLVPKK